MLLAVITFACIAVNWNRNSVIFKNVFVSVKQLELKHERVSQSKWRL